ncbi:MAG: RagB/SusD family nutrient uptake outer membrane protein [Chitinophagaceae bacterium]|nr:RagB/SusD family nutrient uptake outer membrane protein [Chitinophagaceae bacterium]
MKFQAINLLVAILFICTIPVGCKKLVEKPIAVNTPENFYQTPAQVESAYAAAMNELYTEWSGYNGAGNDLFINDDQFFNGDLNITSSHADAAWAMHYGAILNVNTALKAIKNGNLSAFDSEVVDELVGQGRFIRAYNYFTLVRMFGGVPLLTEDSPDPTIESIGRSTVAETYALIESDFLDAIAKLPDNWPDQPGKPAKGAAKSLLAKAYLTMATAPLNETSNYAKAAALADEVMQSGIYHLEELVGDVFQDNHKYGPEMIWSLNANDFDRATDQHTYAPDFLGGWGGGKVEPAFEQSFPTQPRKKAYLFTEYNGLPYTDPSWSPDNYPFIQKYLNVSAEDYDRGKSVLNIPIIRYADVLLIYAEAANKANSGPTQAAVDAINLVRQRANGNSNNPGYPDLTTAMSENDFDDAVIQERSFELCFEMDRWFDLVRKRIVKEKNPTYQQNFTDDDYLFPIPELDLRLNDKLVQNPGYPTP